MFAALLATQPLAAMAQVHKCRIHGVWTYQQSACPSNLPPQRPTVEQLNAQRQRKLQQARESAAPASPVATPPSGTSAAAAPATTPAQPAGVAAPAPHKPFACDGRTRCSQMTSCAEAMYFLARCPGVKMDGDLDGIPCEEQWCQRQ